MTPVIFTSTQISCSLRYDQQNGLLGARNFVSQLSFVKQIKEYLVELAVVCKIISGCNISGLYDEKRDWKFDEDIPLKGQCHQKWMQHWHTDAPYTKRRKAVLNFPSSPLQRCNFEMFIHKKFNLDKLNTAGYCRHVWVRPGQKTTHPLPPSCEPG